EIALRARILPVIKGAVDPFEVEQPDQGLTHALVGKKRPTRIEHESGHAGWRADRQRLLHHASVAQRRKVVAFGPPRRIVLWARVDGAGLESLEHGAG